MTEILALDTNRPGGRRRHTTDAQADTQTDPSETQVAAQAPSNAIPTSALVKLNGKWEVLSEKERLFAEAYAVSGNGTKSAKIAGYSNKTASELARQILKRPRIQAYLSQLQARVVERGAVTLEAEVETLADIRDKAIADRQHNAAVKATETRLRASGLLETRIRMTADQATDEQLLEALQSMLQLCSACTAKVQGLLKPLH